jgi:hypothetical protein
LVTIISLLIIWDKAFLMAMLDEDLGTTITNQNLIQEEIKRRLNSGNACYLSVQNHLSPHLGV